MIPKIKRGQTPSGKKVKKGGLTPFRFTFRFMRALGKQVVG